MIDRGDDNERLAPHVRIDLSEGRVDRLWGGVAARLGGGTRARFGWLWPSVAMSAAAAAAITIAVVRARSVSHDDRAVAAAGSAWEGAQLETAADAVSVTLVDGSNLKVEPRSRVSLTTTISIRSAMSSPVPSACAMKPARPGPRNSACASSKAMARPRPDR